MWGTPKAESRTMVAPGSGFSTDSASPLLTPNVASLKYRPICAAVMLGAAVVSAEYIPSWSLLWGGRAFVVS